MLVLALLLCLYWSCSHACIGLAPMLVLALVLCLYWPCSYACIDLAPMLVLVLFLCLYWPCSYSCIGFAPILVLALLLCLYWPCSYACIGLSLVLLLVFQQKAWNIFVADLIPSRHRRRVGGMWKSFCWIDVLAQYMLTSSCFNASPTA